MPQITPTELPNLIGTQDYVIKKGKIFRKGYYPEKQYGMNEDELARAKNKFNPVPLDLEHTPTLLDKKLGYLIDVELDPSGQVMYGTTAIPKWLDDLNGNQPLKVSATWDRSSKELVGLALVLNPRIDDAVVFNTANSLTPDNQNALELVKFFKGQATKSDYFDNTSNPQRVITEPTEFLTFSYPLARRADIVGRIVVAFNHAVVNNPAVATRVTPVAFGKMGTKTEQKAKAEAKGKTPTGWQNNVGGGAYRSEIPSSDFVLSGERKFPIVAPGDVQDAVSAWGRYKGSVSFEEFKRRLIALAKRKGVEYEKRLPKDWM